jgi:hypothetical protein
MKRLLLALTVPAVAAWADTLPPAPVFKGEIRRGADGALLVQPAEAAPPVAAASRPATMRVGPQEAVKTIGEAARRARDGEVIEIQPGDYAGQPAVWTQDNLLIRGAGARPVMLAAGRDAEGKAIWVVRGGRVRIENIEFRGSRVPHGNGAGIRFEAGHLEVHACHFYDNQMGILTANRAEMSLTVSDSEFGAAPVDLEDLHHLLYVGRIGRFELRGSRFSGGYRGHLVKSRARENHVLYNWLVDGAGGRASYELEFPNGGLAYVVGNVIGQSAGSDNSAMLAYGAEGPHWAENGLYAAHNTWLNDLPAGRLLRVWDEKFPAGVEVWLLNNLNHGHGRFEPPARGRFEGNHGVPFHGLIDDGGERVRLSADSPLRGVVRPPGHARGIDLLPSAEFAFPLGSRPVRPGSRLAPGAFQ